MLIKRGQQSGELSPDLPAKWATRMLAGLIGEALRSVAEGEMKPGEAAEIVYKTFLGGFSPNSH
jgi:hypothetical protein